jgi:quercetin dioxygenase-like cupin family protein
MTSVKQQNTVLDVQKEIATREGFNVRGGDDPIVGYLSKSLWKGKLNVLIAEIQPGMKKNRHAHPNSDSIIYILEGEGEYFIDEKDSRKVKAGDLCIAPAGSLHGVWNTGKVAVRYLCTEGPTPVEFTHEGSWNDPVK